MYKELIFPCRCRWSHICQTTVRATMFPDTPDKVQLGLIKEYTNRPGDPLFVFAMLDRADLEIILSALQAPSEDDQGE